MKISWKSKFQFVEKNYRWVNIQDGLPTEEGHYLAVLKFDKNILIREAPFRNGNFFYDNVLAWRDLPYPFDLDEKDTNWILLKEQFPPESGHYLVSTRLFWQPRKLFPEKYVLEAYVDIEQCGAEFPQETGYWLETYQAWQPLPELPKDLEY